MFSKTKVIKPKTQGNPSALKDWMNLNRVPTPARIGVDIGSSSVKMVELKQTAKGVALTGFAIVPFPHGSIDAQGVQDVEAVAGALRQCWQKMATSTRHVAIAIPPAFVVTKIFRMAGGLTAEQQMNAAEKEAETQLPFPMAEAVWDWMPLAVPGNEPFSALLVAGKKDKLQERIGVIEAAGLIPSVVDVENLALQQLLTMYGSDSAPQHDQAFALVDVGHNVINFSVFRNERPIWTRELAVSRLEVERDWQASMGLDDAEFRMARKSKLPEWEEAGRPMIKRLAEDLARGLMGYHAPTQEDEVSAIYLIGGGSALPNFVDQVQEATLSRVEKWDPFMNIQVPAQWIDTIAADGMLLAVAAGLALRKFDKSLSVGE